MKKFLQISALFSMAIVNAQFTDDIESYNLGSMGTQSPHWSTFSGNPAYMPAIVSNAFAASGSKSVFIGAGNNDGTAGSDAFLLLGDKTSGIWTVQFDMLIPTDKTGYYGFQKLENFDNNPNSWAISILFDSSLTNNNAAVVFLDPANNYDITLVATFTYPVNQWIKFTNVIDIANNQMKLYLNGNVVYDGSYYGAGSLGAVDFFSYGSSNTYYIDNIVYSAGNLMAINETTSTQLSHYIKDGRLYIKNQTPIDSLAIFDASGKTVKSIDYSKKTELSVDIDSYPKGVYYAKGISGKSVFSFKFVK